MISLKKYLDGIQIGPSTDRKSGPKDLLRATIAAYGSALCEMGSCSLDACPALGVGLKQSLNKLVANLSIDMGCETVDSTEKCAQEQLQEWGRRTAGHYRQKTGEVKELLIMMARTAESVGDRDQRCAGQIDAVTSRLRAIVSLEDLSEIRASIVNSAAELKSSIERMAEEGKAAVEQLRTEVSNYQARLDESEEIASRDALTGLRNRLFVESQIESKIADKVPLCVAIIDIDGFKKVNDEHGHLTGDELLKQFASELGSACRSTDMIGRWGGDEFIVLLNCGLSEANAQADRLREWICGNYTIEGKAGSKKLTINASIGIAEHSPEEPMKELLARADAAMYMHKTASRANGSGSSRSNS